MSFDASRFVSRFTPMGDPVGAAIRDVMSARQAREMQEQEMALRREQLAAQQARGREATAMRGASDIAKMSKEQEELALKRQGQEIQRQKERADYLDKVFEARAAGDIGRVGELLKNAGVAWMKVEPEAVQMPDAPSAPAPVPGAEQVGGAGLLGQLAAASATASGQRDFARQKKDYDQEVGRRRKKASTRLHLRKVGPEGPGEEISVFDMADMGASADAAAEAIVTGLGLEPQLAEAVKAGMRLGMTPQEVVAAQTKQMEHAHRVQQDLERNAISHKNLDLQEARMGNLQNDRYFNRSKDVYTKHLKPDVDNYRNQRMMATDVLKNIGMKTGIGDYKAMIGLIKESGGVPSDTDSKYAKNAVGAWNRLNQWVTGWTSAEGAQLTETGRRLFHEFAKESIKNANLKLEDLSGEMARLILDSQVIEDEDAKGRIADYWRRAINRGVPEDGAQEIPDFVAGDDDADIMKELGL